jgi:hypothetical protein
MTFLGKILECRWVISVFFFNWTLSQTFQAVQEVHAGQAMPSHDTQQPAPAIALNTEWEGNFKLKNWGIGSPVS